MTTHEITLIIVLSVLSLISSYGLILYFVFGMIALSAPSRIAFFSSALISFLVYFAFGMQPHTLLNFIVLPIMVWILQKFRTSVFPEGSSTAIVNIRLGILGFILTTVFTCINILIVGAIYGTVIGTFVQYLPNNVLTIILNTALFAVAGNRLYFYLTRQFLKL